MGGSDGTPKPKGDEIRVTVDDGANCQSGRHAILTAENLGFLCEPHSYRGCKKDSCRGSCYREELHGTTTHEII